MMIAAPSPVPVTPPALQSPSRSPRIAAQRRATPPAPEVRLSLICNVLSLHKNKCGEKHILTDNPFFLKGPVLPQSWKHHLPKEQHEWVSRALFRRDEAGKAVLVDSLQMWWYPPPPRPVYHQPPSSPGAFFTRPFCLWMPYRMWSFKLLCKQPNCHRVGQHLTSSGLYKTVRRVLDVDSWYFMATEYLECPRCRKKIAGWSQDILEQMDPAHRVLFPAVLTYR